jgi:hypothetical protein
MPITVKKIILWRSEVDNKPGALARTVEPIAKAGADLKVEGKAAIEVFPITGKRSATAALAAGLGAAPIPTLLVEGDNKPGLGYAIARTLATGGINIAFLVAQVIGKKFAAVVGFRDGGRRKAGCSLNQEGRERHEGLILPASLVRSGLR